MATVTKSPARAGRPPWLVVAEREVRDLWLAGRGLALLLAYAIVLSVTTYFTASNAVLNFLSNRVSLSISLLALFAPTQMPTSAQRGWFG
ncbi:MAG: type transport system permease protein, partial [Kribbellaceae bacterium]|nr:type transport system permease protein [Kribbellaceae bacterium]